MSNLQTEVKPNDIVLIQDVYSTSSGNRTTLIDKLVNVLYVNSNGKIFYNKIVDQIETHLILNDKPRQQAEQKHIKKLQAMLLKNNMLINNIYKIITDERKNLND